jgi:hypothetical protein
MSRRERGAWHDDVDAILAQTSWDRTWHAMVGEMVAALDAKRESRWQRAAGAVAR